MIPNIVTSVGAGAFSYCASLTNFTIPESVTNIGDLAFAGCTSLSAITVDSNNPAYTRLLQSGLCLKINAAGMLGFSCT
jgi:hypothetical protein